MLPQKTRDWGRRQQEDNFMSSKQNLTTVFNKESGEIHLGGIDGPRLTLLELPYALS